METSNFKIFRSNNKENLVKVDKKLHDKCIFDATISLKCKGIFMIMLLEPQKIYTEHDFITPLDKMDSIKRGIKELIKHGYIEKISYGYAISGLVNTKSLSKNSGFVYVISDNYNNYKIGLTNNVARRLDGLKTAMPYDPIVIKILHCSDMYQTEKELHEKFKDKRLNGEWFKLNEKDLDYINLLKGELDG